MNHDINSPSAGPGSTPDSARDLMVAAINDLKEHYGVFYAKALIESFGVRRLVEILPGHYHPAAATAKAMVAAFDGSNTKPALDILVDHIDKYRDHWKNERRHNIEIVLNDHLGPKVSDPLARYAGEVAVPVPAALPVTVRLTPNDIIATLIDIAHKANDLVSGLNMGASDYTNVETQKLENMFDALAPLEQLPAHCAGVIAETGPTRARWALDSFLTGASVTIAGKEALEGIFASMDKLSMGDLVPGVPVMLAQDEGCDVVYGTVVVAPIVARGLAQELDYPGQWDTVAYPTLGEALIEFVGAAKEDAKLEQIVGSVFNVRSYDDTYVHSLVDAVANISTDGARFRTLIWLMEMGREWEDLDQEDARTAEEIEKFANYHRAATIMDACDPNTIDDMRSALDQVTMLGVVPDMPSHFFNLSGAYDKLHDTALRMANELATNYRATVAEDAPRYCKHCGHDMPNDVHDTLGEQHAKGCVVLTARQLIEDTQ